MHVFALCVCRVLNWFRHRNFLVVLTMSKKLSDLHGETSTSHIKPPDVLPGFANINDYTQAGLRMLMENIRVSGGLPSGQKWDYYTSYPSFKRIMDAEGKRVLNLINMILHHQGVRGNILRRDIEEKFELIVDANDQIFERVGNTLDEILGIRKNPEPILMEASGSTRAISGSWNKDAPNKANSAPPPKFQPQSVRLLTAKNIERPQAKFRDKIDNSNSPWEPRIKDKPNSVKPLAIMIEQTEDGECFTHPYEYELDRFSPPESQLQSSKPVEVKPIEDTPLIMVEKKEHISKLLDDLQKCSIFAVDLEHHSYRTFQGFTCLMQISTRDKDYLIDTLALRDELHVLNDVFTKPTILKVFHGAESDILWLQRDLSLYVVNMFDTYQAAKALNFAGLSLSFLMKHFCKVDAEKHFQLADWRIRPLPNELKMYARTDTHYLLYIYECLRNLLIDAANGQTNILQAVYQRSTNVCGRRYVKYTLREDSHMELYRKSKKLFHNQQMYALQHVFAWRDRVAREEDESTGYVLPNHMLLHICELLPREIQGILSCCNPIPPLVRQNLVELHQIILRAREQPLVKPVVEEELRLRPIAETWAKMNSDGPLHCPHDLSHQEDFRDDLPTLLKCSEDDNLEPVANEGIGLIPDNFGVPVAENFSTDLVQSVPQIDFSTPPPPQADARQECEEALQISSRLRRVHFQSPFERYKKMRPYTDTLQRQKLEEHEMEILEREQKSQDSNELTNEQRILRMQEEIQRMTSSSSAVTSDQSSMHELNSSLTMRMQAKGVKRKSEQLKATPFCDEHFGEQPAKHIKKEKDDEKRKNKKKQQNTDIQEHTQKTPRTDFQPYDYKQTDFSRFQGGSRQHDSRSRFKSKGKQNRDGKSFKSTASKATRGLEGHSGSGGGVRGGGGRGRRGRGRGRGR